MRTELDRWEGYFNMDKSKLKEKVTIPMTIEEARKLFGSAQKVSCETYVAVKPKPGFFGYSGYNPTKITNFEILKIGKTCYRKDTGFQNPKYNFEFDFDSIKSELRN